MLFLFLCVILLVILVVILGVILVVIFSCNFSCIFSCDFPVNLRFPFSRGPRIDAGARRKAHRNTQKSDGTWGNGAAGRPPGRFPRAVSPARYLNDVVIRIRFLGNARFRSYQ